MKRNSTFEDFDLNESISSGEFIGSTGELLFVDSYKPENGGRRKSEITLLNVKEGSRKVITAGGFGEGSPKLSRDGKHVLFVSSVPGKGRQIYVYDLETSTARRITRMRFGIMDPFWSDDGKLICFTSFSADGADEKWLQTPADPAEEARYQREQAKRPIIIEDFNYKFDGMGYAQPEVMQLWVVSAEGGENPDGTGEPNFAKRISKGSANFMHAVFDPDCRHVVCESNLYCDKENGIATDVLRIDIETGEIFRVTKDEPVVSYPNPVRPAFTKDGKHLIIGIIDYNEQVTADSGYPSTSIYRVSLDGSEKVKLTVKTEECFDNVSFAYNGGGGRGLEKCRISSDGKYVYFFSGSNGEQRCWKVAVDGENQRPEAVLKGSYSHCGMGQPENGKILYSRTAPTQPEAYYLFDEKTGKSELLYQSNKKMIEEVAYSNPDIVWIDTLDGESRVQGFCMPPQNYEKGKKYPTIVYVHGGPHPYYTFGFDQEAQSFCGAGFGFIYCNPRGSSGYGDVHRNMTRAFDGSAYTDILTFVAEAEKKCDWIDGDRLGMTGGSYGGYMTNYTATRCRKFKAYITQRSVVNELIGYASSDMQGRSVDYPTFGEFMVAKIKESTICGMEKVNAPFLILHGEDDLRCPVEGAHQLFVALKDSHPEDFPIKMVLYPHVGHSQPNQPMQRKHYYNEMVTWFRKYL